jgi:hypothetical protein
MTRNLIFPATLAVAFALAGAPARADEQGRRAPHGGEQHAQAPRAQQARPAEAPRPAEPPRAEMQRAVPRSAPAPRDESQRAVPRAYEVAPRAYAPRYAPRYYPYAGGRYYVAPRVHIAPYRPYLFRPRFELGFGIYVGFPVAYPYAYPYPYPYAYPYAEGPAYSAPPSVAIAPGAAYGGLSFEIAPTAAGVTVDGNYMGTVNDFYDPSRPLSLAAGPHHIDIEAPGYRPMSFDVTVVAGQVIPYRGDLQPL